MRFTLLSLFAACLLFLTGCVHLPSSSSLYSEATPTPVLNHPTGPAAPANASPAKKAIQTTFNWLATLSIAAGVGCLCLGGLSIYRGAIVAGVKFVVAGILLPVAGIFVAYHWLAIVAVVLIGLAAYFLYKDWNKLRPIVGNVVSEVNKVVPAQIHVIPPPTK